MILRAFILDKKTKVFFSHRSLINLELLLFISSLLFIFVHLSCSGRHAQRLCLRLRPNLLNKECCNFLLLSWGRHECSARSDGPAEPCIFRRLELSLAHSSSGAAFSTGKERKVSELPCQGEVLFADWNLALFFNKAAAQKPRSGSTSARDPRGEYLTWWAECKLAAHAPQ